MTRHDRRLLVRRMQHSLGKGFLKVVGRDFFSSLVSSEYEQREGRPNPDPMGAFLNAYQKVLLVYVCVTRTAEFAMDVPMRAYEVPAGKTEEEREALPYDHEANALFRYVNEDYTRAMLTMAMVAYLRLRGDCYLLKEDYRGALNYKGPPKEMYVLRPDRVTVVPGGKDEPAVIGYLYERQGIKYRFAANEVIHLRTFNPNDEFYGQSAIQAGQATILGDFMAEQQQNKLLENMGVVPGFLKVTGSSTSDQRDELRKDWEQGRKLGKTAVLRHDVDWKPTGLSPNDWRNIEQRQFNLQGILALFGMYPAIVGLMDKVAYRTADVQERMFARITVAPVLTLIGEQLTQNLAPEYKNPRLMLAYDTSGKPAFQEDPALLSEIAERVVRNRIMTPNMALSTIFHRKDTVPGGDTFFVPQNYLPIEQLLPEASRAASEPDERGVQYTQRQRQRWLRYYRRFTGVERDLAPIFRKMFTEEEAHAVELLQGARAVSGRTADECIDDAFNYARGAEAMAVALPIACEAGIQHALEALDLGDAFDFSIDDPAIVEFMEEETARAVLHINETTRERLRATLTEGMSKGETTEQLVSRVNAVFRGRRDNAADIARTESEVAIQTTQNACWRASEVVVGKEWLSALIETTRPKHAAEHGNKVKMGELFPVTHMEHPGDPRGGADNVVNCICDMLPVIDRERAFDLIMNSLEDLAEPVGAGRGGSRQCTTRESLRQLSAA
ncbi:MAG: hypothetical protein A2W26_04245 [Acidobacteria bacterium RBG_16_64_8]|nr:MAG: hypothetical protein A2W26_04245 [Acidobacteria bacterium RBG_16_64_8]